MAFRNILVASDGSERSSRALRLAAELAKELEARLAVVHVTEIAALSDMSFIAEVELPRMSPVGAPGPEADAVAEEATSLARESGIECDVVLESGSPWETIVRIADQRSCDLIVMATHGRKGATALLLGSQTQKVLAHSKIPVLAVR